MVRLQTFLLTGLTTALLALPASGAIAAPATFAGSSGTGDAVFFTTIDKLVPGDTDTRADVYVRAYDDGLERYVTRQVSVGPTGGNDAHAASYSGASEDGGKAFFVTKESLVAGDKDLSEDLYARDLTQSATALVSDGDVSCAAQGCGDANVPASPASGGVIPSGQRVFFRSAEQLAPEDGDTATDVYMRDLSNGTTTLVSVGAAGCASEGCGNGDVTVSFRGASVDGTKAFITTEEGLVAGDDDGILDIYRRDLGAAVTVQVSVGGTCPVGADCKASYGGISADGTQAFFETKESLVAQDEDSAQDVYRWLSGTADLISTGPTGGNGDHSATFAAASADGARILFETSEKLTGGDGDGSTDVYERAGSITALVSVGPAGGNAEGVSASLLWASPDGSEDLALFTTAESLTADDQDSFQDVYSREGGSTTRLSTGPGGGNGAFHVSYVDASDDGARVFVTTEEQLVPAGDTDTAADVYELSGGTAVLVSTGPLAGKASVPAGLSPGAVADDGSHAFFTTEERVTEGDLDAETDVHDRFGGGTLLASTGNSDPIGPPTPSQLSTDPASPGSSLTPRVKGQSDPNTAIKIYATPDCSGAPVATGTSLELGGAGILVSVASGSSTSFRATATDTNGDTSPCSAAVSYVHQESTPPPPPPPPPPPTEEEGAGGTGGTGGSGGSKGPGGTGGGSKGVVYVAPQTRITFGPASKTRARRPVFRFTDATGQDGTVFRCKVDRGKWTRCASPVKLKRLSLGRHVFQVKGTNAVGTSEPRPVKRAFKVVGRR